jgi:hypothetical protein
MEESEMEGRPSVEEIIALMEDSRGELATQLCSLVAAWTQVEERTVYDGFCREWTPACYCLDRQLFHLHNFRQGLRATIFVGVRALEPLILDSDQVPEELRLHVVATPGARGTKQVKVPIESPEDVADFARLVRTKWEAIQNGQLGRPPVRPVRKGRPARNEPSLPGQ